MKLRIPTLNTTVWAAIAVAVVFVGVFLFWIFRGTSITVVNEQPSGPLSPLTGLPCAGAHRRPIAIMLASDPEARPLSGISQADMVFEMPVTPNSITRIMAVYQCSDPQEIGSVRSARQDFIPLAQGVDAIFAHWGGEHDALAELDARVVDNVDALKYEGSTFYRKQGIPRPHNGFTTLPLVRERADQLGYRASTSLPAYTHITGKVKRDLGTIADSATVPWLQGMDVRFSYDEASNAYLRWRGGTPEIDTTNREQARASVVIIMKAASSFLRDQYISVATTGSGVATIWQGGRSISALWKKPTATAMLAFTDSQGKAIPLEPGTIWVLIDTPLPAVTQ
ncbi:MAG: DUF3048 domain-containing protein [Patescibacteria group bacterium]